jgi:hypothetical protein
MPKLDRSETRTRTSDTTDSDPKVTARLIAGLLGLAAVGVALGVRRWARRTLREPTAKQLDEIAEPLASIAARHIPAAFLNDDLSDAAQAAAAIGHYLKAGKIITPLRQSQPDIPPNPTESE